MKKLAKKLLKENDSYIDALKSAIYFWENSITMESKRTSIIAIGEIGRDIHKQNLSLGMSKVSYKD